MKSSKQSITIIYIVSLLDLFAVGLTVPLINSHLLSLGASRTTVGIAQSVYSLLQVFCGPIFGSLSDNFGRKLVLIFVTLFCSISYLFLGLCSSISTFLFLRIVSGIIKHTQTLCKAVIADLVSSEEQTEALGFSNGLSSLGFIIGPLIGGYLFEETNGFFLVCSLTSLVFICNLGLVSLLPNIEKRHGIIKNGPDINLYGAITNIKNIPFGQCWGAFLLRLLYGLSSSIFFACQGLYIQGKFDLSQRHVGVVISFFGSVSFFSSLLLGMLTKILYQKDSNCHQRMLHAYFLMSFALLGVYFSTNIYQYLFFLFPYAISSTALRIISMELLLNSSKDQNNKGCIAGASNSVMSAARLISPIPSGYIADQFGEAANILTALVPSIFGTVITFVLSNKQSRKPKIQ